MKGELAGVHLCCGIHRIEIVENFVITFPFNIRFKFVPLIH